MDDFRRFRPVLPTLVPGKEREMRYQKDTDHKMQSVSSYKFRQRLTVKSSFSANMSRRPSHNYLSLTKASARLPVRRGSSYRVFEMTWGG
jgi:hypothetical protein